MAIDSTPPSVYPLANKQGTAIPLDVARPLEGFISNIGVGEALTVSLPIGGAFYMLSVTSTDYCRLTVNTSLGEEASFIMIPNVLYDLALKPSTDGGAATLTNIGDGESTTVANVIQRWTQMDNQNYAAS